MITNLLSNAIKFTSRGEVNIRVRQESHEGNVARIRFEIQDSGIGISGASAKKLFRAFSQADSSTHRKFGGTGLGLSISKRLVELMKGKIGVESHEGYGSTFWFSLPLKCASIRVQPRMSGEPLPLHFTRARILIAEDNPVNQKIALKQLEKLGYRADSVANGNEVLHALSQIPYDLLLMDCQMPDLDGFEATALIRRSRSLTHPMIPIIAMTANAMTGDRERCLSAGMDDYVSKPTQIEALGQVIEKWLELKPAHSTRRDAA